MAYTFTGTYIRGLDEWINHDPRNDEEPVTECSECGNGIFDGEDYYEIGGKCYCEKCIESFKKTAEEPDEWFGEE